MLHRIATHVSPSLIWPSIQLCREEAREKEWRVEGGVGKGGKGKGGEERGRVEGGEGRGQGKGVEG